MHKILLFSGGVYKYELLTEHVDDVGGLIVREDNLHISRGTSFLSDELRVMLIVPSNEVSSVKSIVKDIKGEIEELKLEKNVHENLINILKIYDVLCKTNSWLDTNSIKKMMETLHPNGFIEIDDYVEYNNKTMQKLEECLDLMLSLKIVNKQKNNAKYEYCISEDYKP